MVRLSKECGFSTVRIGRVLGRDHSTIVNLMRRHEGVPLTRKGTQMKRRKGTK